MGVVYRNVHIDKDTAAKEMQKHNDKLAWDYNLEGVLKRIISSSLTRHNNSFIFVSAHLVRKILKKTCAMAAALLCERW